MRSAIAARREDDMRVFMIYFAVNLLAGMSIYAVLEYTGMTEKECRAIATVSMIGGALLTLLFQ